MTVTPSESLTRALGKLGFAAMTINGLISAGIFALTVYRWIRAA